MNTNDIQQSPDTPQQLANIAGWLDWCTDQNQRLIAATAYKAHPNQADNKTARGERYRAAILALGYSDEVANIFAEGYRVTPQQATCTVQRRREEELKQQERQQKLERETAKREKWEKSKAGRRHARRMSQQVLQLHYCNDDFGVICVTKKVYHALLKTPVRARFMAFCDGTLGDQRRDVKVYTTPKSARRAVAKKLLCSYKKGNDGLGGLVGMRMLGWKNPDELTKDKKDKIHAYFVNRILPWCNKQLTATKRMESN